MAENNTGALERLEAFASELSEWYWAQGCRRAGSYALSPGSWLESVYTIRKRAELLGHIPAGGRPCMALWGPSQSGKSTLLSEFIDRPALGLASALQWKDIDPVAFVGGAGGDVLKLNPYNFNADASGCVTRFYLASKPPHPDYPVELLPARPAQLLQAIAIGYLTECEQPGELVIWDKDRLRLMLSSYPQAGGAPDRESYEFLHDAVSVVDDLILARWPRYRNLAPDWRHLRREVLECGTLTGDPAAAREFAARLLWDGHKRLTHFYEELTGALAGLRPASAGRLLATHKFAKQLLDISAAEHLDPAEMTALLSAPCGNDVYFGTSQGKCVAGDPESFAKFQALIWEIRLPLNARVLARTAPELRQVLERIDILDFPGVSQEGLGGTRPSVRAHPPLNLFTKVLKRGKTASVVVSYARCLGIDGFSLLIRMQNPVPQPEQILAGLTAWTHEMGHPWPPVEDPPPLNVVLTFSAKLVNAAASALANDENLAAMRHVFEWFDSIQPIADPAWARFSATSYPRFEEGRVTAEPELAARAAAAIAGHPAFRHRFGADPEQIRLMSLAARSAEGDGGVTRFLQSAAEPLQASPLPERRRALDAELLRRLQELAREAVPLDLTGTEARRKDLGDWKRQILEGVTERQRSRPEEDAAAHVSALLLRLLSVHEEDLDEIPANARASPIDAYVAEQVRLRWLESARDAGHEWHLAGLDSPATAARRLNCLADYLIEHGELAAWIKTHLGTLDRPEARRSARRFLALKLSDLLLCGCRGRARLEEAAGPAACGRIQQRLNGYSQHESGLGPGSPVQRSPHFDAVIRPFFAALDEIARAQISPRPTQPGDGELSEIIDRHAYTTAP